MLAEASGCLCFSVRVSAAAAIYFWGGIMLLSILGYSIHYKIPTTMDQQSQHFEYQGFKFQWRALQLKLRKTWQTSHSVSHSRTNFLVTITAGDKVGTGQAGLPPKKPGCYLADVNDCFAFMQKLRERVKSQAFVLDNQIINIGNFFKEFRNHSEREKYYKVLSALHHLMEPIDRAAISACEYALFDLWAKILNLPLLECIYSQGQAIQFKSFCSVSIGENQIEEAKQASKLTPYIKLKFNEDLETIEKNLVQLISENVGKLYVLDANAAWSVETTRKVIEFIAERGYQQKVYCLEQPYPLYPGEEWRDVYNLAKDKGIRIVADESFTNGDDIEKVEGISNGVNIKIQKTGGLLEAIKSALKAKQANMEIWLGTMVSSWQGCTQTYMLAPFAHYGDLDGGLLVYSLFQGGFLWTPDGVLSPVQGTGLCVGEAKLQ